MASAKCNQEYLAVAKNRFSWSNFQFLLRDQLGRGFAKVSYGNVHYENRKN